MSDGTSLSLCCVAAKLTAEQRDDLVKELHVFAAGMKPACTWHKNEALQTARECCGGMVSCLGCFWAVDAP